MAKFEEEKHSDTQLTETKLIMSCAESLNKEKQNNKKWIRAVCAGVFSSLSPCVRACVRGSM